MFEQLMREARRGCKVCWLTDPYIWCLCLHLRLHSSLRALLATITEVLFTDISTPHQHLLGGPSANTRIHPCRFKIHCRQYPWPSASADPKLGEAASADALPPAQQAAAPQQEAADLFSSRSAVRPAPLRPTKGGGTVLLPGGREGGGVTRGVDVALLLGESRPDRWPRGARDRRQEPPRVSQAPRG